MSGIVWIVGTGFAVLGVWIAIIDQRSRRIPNSMVIPATVSAVVWACAVAIAHADIAVLFTALGGGASLFVVFFALAWISRGGLGGGDVKFAGYLGTLLGLYGGFTSVVVAAAAMFLCGGVVSALTLALNRAGRKEPLPFGPWMMVGAVIGLLGGIQ